MRTFSLPYRIRIWSGAALLAIVMMALPIATGVYVVVLSIRSDTQQRLTQTTQQVLMQFRGALDVASNLLAMIENTHAFCSAEHVMHMRRVIDDAPEIVEMGYLDNGLVRCTDGSMLMQQEKSEQEVFSLANGLQVTRTLNPSMHSSAHLIRLQSGAHYLLLDPARFADISLPQDIGWVVATTEGNLLAGHNDTEVLRRSALDMLDFPVAPNAGDVVLRDIMLIVISRSIDDALVAKMKNKHVAILMFWILLAVLFAGIVLCLARRHLSPCSRMREALRRGEFHVHYQPLLDLQSGKCVGAEALLRWQHADGQMTPPDLFIPLAEMHGLIPALTDHVIARIVSELASEMAERPEFHVGINVGVQDLQSGRIIDVLQDRLMATGIRPEQIWLELTEQGFRDIKKSQVTLSRAKAIGYKTAIDDFGTGYSSLSCLEDLSLDLLKIDKSFIKQDPEQGQLLNHIIAIGKSLGMQIVAEGIETEEQRSWLRNNGVEYGQGWLYSPAIPPSEFVNFLKKSLVPSSAIQVRV